MSQLITESNAASQSRAPSVDLDHMETEPSAQKGEHPVVETETEVEAHAELEPEIEKEADDAESIMGRLKGGLDGLRTATLSRADVYKIEDMLMDMKRELFEAERRGRGSV